MEMVFEAGKAQNSAPSPTPSRKETPLLPGSKKGAEIVQHPRGLQILLSLCHKPFIFIWFMAGTTGLEPATSAVTVSGKRVTNRNQGQRTTPVAP
jgi:hypothetical protein